MGELICLDAATGEPLGHKITPKTASHTLCIALLDEAGCTVFPEPADVTFAWAHNGAESPRSPGTCVHEDGRVYTSGDLLMAAASLSLKAWDDDPA